MSDENAPLPPAPAAAARPARRPRTATVGALIALLACGATVAIPCIVSVIAIADPYALSGDGTYVGFDSGMAAGLGIALLLNAVPIIAAIGTLRNSNGWRITLIVFAFICAAAAGLLLLVAVASIGGDDPAPWPVWAIATGYLAASLSSAILLLTNGANAWFSPPRVSMNPVPTLGYAPTFPPPPVASPQVPATYATSPYAGSPYATSPYVGDPAALAPEHPRATTALVLGIVAAVLAGTCFVPGPFFGIPAWIIGARALKDIDRSNTPYGNRGNAKAGLILGILSTIVGLIATVIVVIVIVVAVHRHGMQMHRGVEV